MPDVAAAVAACFAETAADSRPLHLLAAGSFTQWLDTRSPDERRWLECLGFEAKPGRLALLPAGDGRLTGAVAIASDPPEPWDLAGARAGLPPGTWRLAGGGLGLDEPACATAWAMGAYRFERYKTEPRPERRLVVADATARQRAAAVAGAVWLARDLVNTPANDLGPAELAAAVESVAAAHGAEFRNVEGEALTAGYPMIHAVGRGSVRAPRLVELRWGRPEARRLTLVGKGVCFDTGGLDIKPSSNMLLMRKDMGGAALMLGLAQAIMALGLDLRLRLLIPAVENSISGEAFRPGDILRSRQGLTVEIGNTDAEGRLVLADALTDAASEEPELILDAATLTGAARVALGPDLPALFTRDDALAQDLLAAGEATAEPLWRLPLHKGYARYLESPSADLNNTGAKPFAGAITAALFLARFVPDGIPWAHLDIFAWNDEAKPGRPRGGEATALRPLLAMIEARFGGAAS